MGNHDNMNRKKDKGIKEKVKEGEGIEGQKTIGEMGGGTRDKASVTIETGIFETILNIIKTLPLEFHELKKS